MFKESALLDLGRLKDLLSIQSELYCVRCLNCGLSYLNPMPTFEELRQYYESDFDIIVNRNSQSYLKGSDYIRNQLVAFEKFVRKGRLLDIGCGTGNFVFRARELGWDAYGIEISKRNSAFLRNELGLNVLNASIEEVNLGSEYFDVVILNHVLEHLFDPKSVLRKISGFLRKGGILAIYVPNELESLYSKLMLDDFLFYCQPRERPTDHLYFFNKKTIQLLLRNTGYRVIRLTTRNLRINTNHKNRYGLVGDVAKKTYCWIADSLKVGDLMNVIATKGYSVDYRI
ncbi:MAG: class I SAM-dependent methyltransferase [Candidatus Hodarchaeota archaeon]